MTTPTFEPPQELPRTGRREPAAEASPAENPSSVDFVVLPPDESALNVDDLLASIPMPSDSSTDSVALDLPPIEVAEPAILALDDLAVEVEQPAYALREESINLDMQLHEPAPLEADHGVDVQAGAQGFQESLLAHEPQVGMTLEAMHLETDADLVSDEAVIGSAVAAAKGAQKNGEDDQSFVQKHKPKLIIAAIVLALVGVKLYQQMNPVKPAVVKIDPASTPVFEEAIKDMQGGADNVSHLDASPYDPFADVPSADGAADPFQDDAGVAPTENLTAAADQMAQLPVAGSPAPTPVTTPQAAAPTAPVSQPIEQQAVVEPVAPIEPVTPIEAAQPPIEPAGPTVATAAAQAEAPPVPEAASGAVVQDLKEQLRSMTARAEKAEEELRRLKAGPASAPQKPQPKVVQRKPVQQPVKRPTQVASNRAAAAPAPVASKKRGDVQYIGSFLKEGKWGAHVVIAGNLYELSSGQSMAGLKVNSVSGSGVVINGTEYR